MSSLHLHGDNSVVLGAEVLRQWGSAAFTVPEVMLISLAFLLCTRVTKTCKKASIRALPPHQISFNSGRSSKVFWWGLTEQGPSEGPACPAPTSLVWSSHWKKLVDWLCVPPQCLFSLVVRRVLWLCDEWDYKLIWCKKINSFSQMSFTWTNSWTGLWHWLHEISCWHASWLGDNELSSGTRVYAVTYVEIQL